jgi:hypothetical protein
VKSARKSDTASTHRNRLANRFWQTKDFCSLQKYLAKLFARREKRGHHGIRTPPRARGGRPTPIDSAAPPPTHPLPHSMHILSREWFNIVWSLGYVLFTAVTSTLMLLVPATLLRLISAELSSKATSAVGLCNWNAVDPYAHTHTHTHAHTRHAHTHTHAHIRHTHPHPPTPTQSLTAPGLPLYSSRERPVSKAFASKRVNLYRYSAIFSCWWTSCLFITERLNGVTVRVTGDALPLGVPLLIMVGPPPVDDSQPVRPTQPFD